MAKEDIKEMLDAGVHFGHLKRKWNPNMAPYIFMERNGTHIIDLYKTKAKLDEASAAMRQIAQSGRKILFVATKKQAHEYVKREAERVGMPYVTERWPGGMLTNFATIRKAVRKMESIDNMAKDGTLDNMSKKERLLVSRQREKLEKDFGSIKDLTKLPAAMFVVDIQREDIAVAEAKKLNITTFALVDTNSNPNEVDFPVPANDDAAQSIELLVTKVADAIQEGLEERKTKKGKDKTEKEAKKKKKTEKTEKKEEKEAEA